MPPRLQAVLDPHLEVHVTALRPLFYRLGANEALDRPAHVRAASGLARVGPFVAVIQDDANFIALLDIALLGAQFEGAEAVTLPRGPDGTRQFDDLRGNKSLKLDLEACVVVAEGSDEVLVAFGSGSSPRRESIVEVRAIAAGRPKVRVLQAAELYASLRAATDFAGSELNIEGAVVIDGCLRLFNRGNGAPRGALLPVNASCDLDPTMFLAYLRAPRRALPPAPKNIVHYDLKSLGGQRLGFTDATLAPGCAVLFSAAAEASPSATEDGPVAGSVLGVIDRTGRARYAVIRTAAGERFNGKVEGLLLYPAQKTRLLMVVDQDAPELPSELCEARLRGPWFEGE
ncbi:MAG: hypothetical protein M3511_08230 [Deinococcota bacterium]|nr:hypothetical protein [Deinococcota bacterium]